jgi:hypothetical protein
VTRLRSAVLDSGNIGTDLSHKLIRSNSLDPVLMMGVAIVMDSLWGMQASTDRSCSTPGAQLSATAWRPVSRRHRTRPAQELGRP